MTHKDIKKLKNGTILHFSAGDAIIYRLNHYHVGDNALCLVQNFFDGCTSMIKNLHSFPQLNKYKHVYCINSKYSYDQFIQDYGKCYIKRIINFKLI